MRQIKNLMAALVVLILAAVFAPNAKALPITATNGVTFLGLDTFRKDTIYVYPEGSGPVSDQDFYYRLGDGSGHTYCHLSQWLADDVLNGEWTYGHPFYVPSNGYYQHYDYWTGDGVRHTTVSLFALQ